MNRFLKSLGILIVSLVLLALGLNAALDHLSCTPHTSRVVIAKNGTTVVYVGTVTRLAELEKPDASLPDHLQRGKVPAPQYRWL